MTVTAPVMSAAPPGGGAAVRLALIVGRAGAVLAELGRADRAGAEVAVAGGPPIGAAVVVGAAERRADLGRRRVRHGGALQVAHALVVGGAGEGEVARIAPRPRRAVPCDRDRQTDVAEAAAR